MPVRLNSGSRVRRLRLVGLIPAAIIIIVVALTTVAVSTRAWFTPARAGGRQGQIQAQAQATPSIPVDVVRLALRTFGFEEKEITRKAGPVYFFVENVSGFRQVNFRLDREAGARLKDVPLPKGKFRWQEVVNLTPGTYLLTVAENPNWVCRITITAR